MCHTGGRENSQLSESVSLSSNNPFPPIQDKVKTKVRTLAINVNSYNSVEKYRQCQRKLMIHGQMESAVKGHWGVKSS